MRACRLIRPEPSFKVVLNANVFIELKRTFGMRSTSISRSSDLLLEQCAQLLCAGFVAQVIPSQCDAECKAKTDKRAFAL